MMIWRVRVRCDYMDGPSVPKHCYERAIVQASDSCEALEAGEKFVESKAPIGTNWRGFQSIEAAAIELPILVKAL